MDDAALVLKYNLSKEGLQIAFTKLIASGVLKQADVDNRASAHARTINPGWKCPACGKPQPKEVEECPVCGIIVRKYLSNDAPMAVSDSEGSMFGTKSLWGVVILLLLGLLWLGWHYRATVAEERRSEAARLEQLERIEEQRRLQAEANERANQLALQQEEIRGQREAERTQKERQSQQDKENDEWRKQEEALVRAEQEGQQQQASQQSDKEKRERLRVIRAYLKMLRLARDMSISLLGEDVLLTVPRLKPRISQFADGLLELKATPGADPLVIDHYDRAFRHLVTALSARSRKAKYDSVRMWKQACSRAQAQMKVSH